MRVRACIALSDMCLTTSCVTHISMFVEVHITTRACIALYTSLHLSLRISDRARLSLQVHDRQLYDLKSTMHKLYTIRRALHPDMIF